MRREQCNVSLGFTPVLDEFSMMSLSSAAGFDKNWLLVGATEVSLGMIRNSMVCRPSAINESLPLSLYRDSKIVLPFGMTLLLKIISPSNSDIKLSTRSRGITVSSGTSSGESSYPSS